MKLKDAKFFLDNPKSLTPTFVFLSIYCQDKRLKYSTRYKVVPAPYKLDSFLKVV